MICNLIWSMCIFLGVLSMLSFIFSEKHDKLMYKAIGIILLMFSITFYILWLITCILGVKSL